jgi:hypothetical protein
VAVGTAHGQPLHGHRASRPRPLKALELSCSLPTPFSILLSSTRYSNHKIGPRPCSPMAPWWPSCPLPCPWLDAPLPEPLAGAPKSLVFPCAGAETRMDAPSQAPERAGQQHLHSLGSKSLGGFSQCWNPMQPPMVPSHPAMAATLTLCTRATFIFKHSKLPRQSACACTRQRKKMTP